MHYFCSSFFACNINAYFRSCLTIIMNFLVVQVHVLVDFVQKVQIRLELKTSFLTTLGRLLLKVLLLGRCRFVRHLLWHVSLVCIPRIKVVLILFSLVLVELLLLSPEEFFFCLGIGCPVVHIFECEVSSTYDLEVFGKLACVGPNKLALTILRLFVLVLVVQLLLRFKIVVLTLIQ